MPRHHLIFALALLALAGCDRIGQSGDAGPDPNLGKLAERVAELHQCLNAQATDCERYLAQDDGVISGMESVRKILPQLSQHTRRFAAIAWDEPKLQTSGVAGENLYVITGTTALVGGEKVYLRYMLVQQTGELKFFGISLSGQPLAAVIQ